MKGEIKTILLNQPVYNKSSHVCVCSIKTNPRLNPSTQRELGFSVRKREFQGSHPLTLHGPLYVVSVGAYPWTGPRLWRLRSSLHTRHSHLLLSEKGDTDKRPEGSSKILSTMKAKGPQVAQYLGYKGEEFNSTTGIKHRGEVQKITFKLGGT